LPTYDVYVQYPVFSARPLDMGASSQWRDIRRSRLLAKGTEAWVGPSATCTSCLYAGQLVGQGHTLELKTDPLIYRAMQYLLPQNSDRYR